ncbi:MAG: BatD family protein, partial [Deltaproteobacteria bacterium]|nr:BatD family protein [Deltaproteobacteria bacterium]
MGRTNCLLETEHRRTLLLSVFVCLLALLFDGGFSPHASAQEISARLSPLKFTTEQPATLTITISGQQSAELMIPEVDGLIFHRRGQSSQFQMVNGAVSSSITYTYLVQALKPGDYTIPAIAAKLKKGT